MSTASWISTWIVAVCQSAIFGMTTFDLKTGKHRKYTYVRLALSGCAAICAWIVIIGTYLGF